MCSLSPLVTAQAVLAHARPGHPTGQCSVQARSTVRPDSLLVSISSLGHLMPGGELSAHSTLLGDLATCDSGVSVRRTRLVLAPGPGGWDPGLCGGAVAVL